MTHTIIPTVNVGDVLALKVAPAFPGRDGFTVTGEVLKAREGKNIPLKVGKGAVLLDNETKVVAVSPGRPEYKKGVISVVPTLVVPHDVDVGTGNVRFDGDIVIKGNIAENLKVSAGGDITVFGNIYHANVYAKGNIRVHGNIINSKVSAGLNMLNYLGVTPKLKQILEVVKECRSVAKLSEMSKNHVDIRRELLQVVISKKDILDNLMKDIQNLIKLSIDEETNELIRILEDVKRILTGVNAKCIEDSRQIKTLYTEINDYINKIEELYGNEADIIFEYGQTSFIQANGNVVIADKGCYQTNLMAKNAILFKKPSSIVRGGLLIAGKCIKMGIVGTPSGISTYCKVLDRNGKIDAVYYYSNTVLNINDNIKVIDSNFYVNRDNK
ncbi:FapA family protein [Petroclostridium xylanilyticum]|uniref:FapA family protein n=1 Tax=Petroclostridium xylanilyticum TaxID=1792311 RepID=UPI000B993E56|nr:FapA family protein [Petroclostridium xylanilyticum]